MGQQEKPEIGLDFGSSISFIDGSEKRISDTPPLGMVPMKDRLAAGLTFYRLTDDGRVTCGDSFPFHLLSAEEWHNIVAIDAALVHAVGLRSDGTVVAAGHDLHGECSVSAWKNMTAICTNENTTFGLRRDGTVAATGEDWDTSSLRNVTKLACSFALLLGLHADGTLTAVGSKGRMQALCGKTQTWRDLVAAAAGGCFIVGLHGDGTLTAVGDNSDGACNVSNWQNMISVRCGLLHTVGLRSDGTVAATGDNSNGQCDVSSWRNIVAIAAGNLETYGLRADGTVVSTEKKPQKVQEKTDFTAKASQGKIVHTHKSVTPAGQTWPQPPTDPMKEQRTAAFWGNRIAVNACGFAAVTRRGRVYAANGFVETSCMEDVEEWDNLISIKAGSFHFVGLRADGTVVAAGDNTYGQCNVETWRDVIAIAAGGNCTYALCRDGRILSTEPLIVDGKETATLSAPCGTVAIFSNVNGELCSLTSGGLVTVHVTEPRNNTTFSGVEHWEDIISLAMDERHIVGLCSDGTVVATGENESHQCDVDSWSDMIAVYTKHNKTIGLEVYGTINLTSMTMHEWLINVWDDIIALSTAQSSLSWTLGVTKNGTVVSNIEGADTVTSDWNLFD